MSFQHCQETQTRLKPEMKHARKSLVCGGNRLRAGFVQIPQSYGSVATARRESSRCRECYRSHSVSVMSECHSVAITLEGTAALVCAHTVWLQVLWDKEPLVMLIYSLFGRCVYYCPSAMMQQFSHRYERTRSTCLPDQLAKDCAHNIYIYTHSHTPALGSSYVLTTWPWLRLVQWPDDITLSTSHVAKLTRPKRAPAVATNMRWHCELPSLLPQNCMSSTGSELIGAMLS